MPTYEPCSDIECPEPARTRGLCKAHYCRWWRKNKVEAYHKNLERNSERERIKCLDPEYRKKRHDEGERGLIRRINEKLSVIDYYSNGLMKCCCEGCDSSLIEFLSIDHINNNGKEHRIQLRKEGTTIYRWLIKQGFPTGYQVLCYNCNMSKGFFHYCPHNSKSRFEKL